MRSRKRLRSRRSSWSSWETSSSRPTSFAPLKASPRRPRLWKGSANVPPRCGPLSMRHKRRNARSISMSSSSSASRSSVAGTLRKRKTATTTTTLASWRNLRLCSSKKACRSATTTRLQFRCQYFAEEEDAEEEDERQEERHPVWSSLPRLRRRRSPWQRKRQPRRHPHLLRRCQRRRRRRRCRTSRPPEPAPATLPPLI
mmetsp:Transcript_2711/g.9873  ORF Transcript_2711/g.9873 Transcript_2711/m.9873 type:complete len:200 (-) Transcript_2711:1612-2211(-)